MAFVRQLAATSEFIRGQKANLHETSVLLALESYKRSYEIHKPNRPSSEANSALYSGLDLLPNHLFAAISHQSQVWEIEFSSDSQYFATRSRYGTAKIVHLSTGQETTISHQGQVGEIEFSGDSQYFASGSKDGTAKIVHLSTGKETVLSHQDEVTGIEFSGDSQYFASGSKDGTVKLVELSTGKETVLSHQDEVDEIEFSGDSQYLATTAKNNVRLTLLDAEKSSALTCGKLSQNLSLLSWQRYVDDEPYDKTCDNLPIHPSFLREGKKLAQEGKIPEAISIYKRAKKLEPGIDLDSNTETIEQNPRQVANQFFAPTQLQQGETLAKEGKIAEAVTAYKKAQKLDPELEIEADSWNLLCRFGSIFRQAKRAIFACEQAVELAPDAKSQADYRDSRGLARALIGDQKGAIADFKAYVDFPDKSEEYKTQRKQWIQALEKGENPFTDEILEELKNQ